MIQKIILTFTLIVMISNLFGQVGVINDKDGFTNLREAPNIKSKVLYKIQDYELFLYEPEDLGVNAQWIKVYIPKNKYTLGCDEADNLIGYIHKSRFQTLEELNKYKGADFSFRYNLDTFKIENKIVDYFDNKWISGINGRRYYGTDGDVPKNEILSIDVNVNETIISVPKILYQDLFELSNDFIVYKKNDLFYVKQWNSDGAGGYLLIWAIDKNGVQQRLIFKP